MSGDEGEDYNGDSAPSNEGGADVIDADSELDEFPIEDEAGELADSSGLLLGQDEDEDELDEIDTYDEEVLEAQGTDEGALNHQPEPQGEGAAVPAAKIKRPSSAWMIYINEQRDRMRREYPGMSIGEVAKALSAEYKALAPEVAEKYLDLARKDKERYLEAKRNVPPVTLGTVNARGGSSEPIPPGELVFPLVSISNCCYDTIHVFDTFALRQELKK
jgi:structure-specific recognition protein 1